MNEITPLVQHLQTLTAALDDVGRALQGALAGLQVNGQEFRSFGRDDQGKQHAARVKRLAHRTRIPVALFGQPGPWS
jgi:hypothetical protein